MADITPERLTELTQRFTAALCMTPAEFIEVIWPALNERIAEEWDAFPLWESRPVVEAPHVVDERTVRRG